MLTWEMIEYFYVSMAWSGSDNHCKMGSLVVVYLLIDWNFYSHYHFVSSFALFLCLSYGRRPYLYPMHLAPWLNSDKFLSKLSFSSTWFFNKNFQFNISQQQHNPTLSIAIYQCSPSSLREFDDNGQVYSIVELAEIASSSDENVSPRKERKGQTFALLLELKQLTQTMLELKSLVINNVFSRDPSICLESGNCVLILSQRINSPNKQISKIYGSEINNAY